MGIRRPADRRLTDRRTAKPVAQHTTALRVTAEELALIRIAAAKRGLTAGGYIRAVVIPIATEEAQAA